MLSGMQVIDFRNVSFHSLSAHKVLCAGAKPSLSSAPDELLRLIPKASVCMHHLILIYAQYKSIEGLILTSNYRFSLASIICFVFVPAFAKNSAVSRSQSELFNILVT